MNENPLVMTFDYGTQSVRASIFDCEGNVLASEKKKYEPPYFSKKPGWAEQDADYYFDCLCQCTKALAKKHPDLLSRVEAITQTCFRDSAVLLDENNKLVRPMILWIDQREAKCEDKLPLGSRFLFALVGKTETISLNRKRTAANWIKENEPENWAKTKKYVAVSAYFIYRLIGEVKDTASSFTGHYPIDYKKRAWYKDPMKHMQGRVFGVRKDQLCELVPSLSYLGQISEKASKDLGIPEGIKVYAGASDKSCETLGDGVIDSSMAAISLGTACTIETVTEKYTSPFPFLPEYPSIIPDKYNLDLQIYRGFWTVNWFLKEFGLSDIKDLIAEDGDPTYFNEHLKDVPPGSDGLILQPFWGSPLEKPEVRGSVIGFSDRTTREHFYRALIEGILFELRMGMERFEKLTKGSFEEIRISGGGAQSDDICQIAADLLNKPVVRVQTIETASLGAATAAYLALGIYKTPSEAVGKMVHPCTKFLPNKDNVAIYNELYENVYSSLYHSLKKQYKYLYHYSISK